jgi:hypothetical protein
VLYQLSYGPIAGYKIPVLVLLRTADVYYCELLTNGDCELLTSLRTADCGQRVSCAFMVPTKGVADGN